MDIRCKTAHGPVHAHLVGTAELAHPNVPLPQHSFNAVMPVLLFDGRLNFLSIKMQAAKEK
jgi:hypothetical protein